jgi:hypothetical protein
MVLDTSGQLQDLVNKYTGLNKPSDAASRASLLDTLIYTLAGVQNVDPTSRAATQIYGNVIGDARKLATLETFLGEGFLGTWCWGTRDANPHGKTTQQIQSMKLVDGQAYKNNSFECVIR